MKKLFALLLSAAMTLSLASCGTPAPAASASGSAAASQSAAASDLKGTELNIVCTSESYAPLFDAFAQETGVTYNYLSMSSGEVIAQLDAGGEPAADLWFGGGIDAFMSAKEKGYLEKVDFDGAAALESAYKDADNYWFSKGLTVVGFIVNNDLLTEKGLSAPEKWDDLLNPAYQGEIIMSNPAISGTNYAVVNALLQTKGEEAGWQYFNDLNSNILYYSRRGSDPKTKVAAGEAAVGITFIDNSITAMMDTDPVTVIYPSDGMPYVPEGVAAFANSQNTAAAAAFIQWLFESDAHLAQLAEIDGKNSVKVIKPAMEGVALDFDTSILMNEDLSLFGSQRDQILEKFETLMGDKAESEAAAS